LSIVDLLIRTTGARSFSLARNSPGRW